MGRMHTLTPSARVPASPPRPLLRAADVVVAAVGLLLMLPVMASVAIAVRLSSHGPVLRRERHKRPTGTSVNLLSFRVLVDGGETQAHAQLRAAIGAEHAVPLTGVGRFLQRTRLDRLPRLVNLLAGHVSLFA